MKNLNDTEIMVLIVAFFLSIGVAIGWGINRWSDWHHKTIAAAEAYYSEKAFYDRQFQNFLREVQK